LHVDADDMGADEVSIISWRRILEVFADGMSDEGFDLGRRHTAHGAGMPGLSTQER
jgi:hypothetical protein